MTDMARHAPWKARGPKVGPIKSKHINFFRTELEAAQAYDSYVGTMPISDIEKHKRKNFT